MKTFLIQGLLLLLALMMGAFLGTAAKRKTDRISKMTPGYGARKW